MRIAAAVASLGHSAAGWTLLEPGTELARGYRTSVQFEHPFTQAPIVHAGLAGFDIENGDAARVRLKVSAVRADGFDLEVETWFATRIWSIDVSWLAIGH